MTTANPSDEMPDRQLIAAYCRTLYCVCAGPSEIVLRVDHYDPFAERRILSLHPLEHHWSILTPFNPRSCALAPAENAKRLQALLGFLHRRRQSWLPTLNRDPEGRWPDEAGALLCDPPTHLTEMLGRRFGQIAFLSGQIGKAPRLVWLVSPETDR